ncbi:hypothetical protein K8Q80_23210 [Escherichia coli]|uniref:gp53-like domain-containing protein n=1 Tax=Escherichia coli TaxID=562 RepID=UPI004067E59E
MAGTNDFKAFATDANANVTSQEEWETLTALKKGFSSGKASSAQVSKALRQPSTMAAVLGQFIANAELDALDDGDVDGLVAKLATAITTNLGLGEGAKLGAAVCVTGSTGYMTIPAMVAGKERVIILQWFGAATTDYVTPVTANFPIAFPNECMIPLFSDVSTWAVDLSSTAAYSLAVGRSYYTTVTRTQITCAGYGGFRVFAIGW